MIAQKISPGNCSWRKIAQLWNVVDDVAIQHGHGIHMNPWNRRRLGSGAVSPFQGGGQFLSQSRSAKSIKAWDG
jgi:ABC-type sulfate transport system substrate-binding protein